MMRTELKKFLHQVAVKNQGQTEFLQAVEEVIEDIFGFVSASQEYLSSGILPRLVEPDRIVSFRVAWQDDDGKIQVNRGWRVQHSNAIGPYKGGLRFHEDVNESVLKFLAFEQTLKNSLTGLPMGGAKGGANFNPRGRSNGEIMRFCQSFMTELYRYVGHEVDIPAGDIGVGPKEIGYLFGQYKRITNQFAGVITGKGLEYGGSFIRMEATGYGAVFFLERMLANSGHQLEDKRCVVSGSGNVACHAAEKLLIQGGKVVTLSDSDGFVHIPRGLSGEQLEWVKQRMMIDRECISTFAEVFPEISYYRGQKPWSVPCDIVVPCATQNEIGLSEAKQLVVNGCIAVVEGANMPTSASAVKCFLESGILFAPGKAANAGGVAVSGLELSQNSSRVSWKRHDLELKLLEIMHDIHDRCLRYGTSEEHAVPNYVRGANRAGFQKVAKAMLAFGVV